MFVIIILKLLGILGKFWEFDNGNLGRPRDRNPLYALENSNQKTWNPQIIDWWSKWGNVYYAITDVSIKIIPLSDSSTLVLIMYLLLSYL